MPSLRFSSSLVLALWCLCLKAQVQDTLPNDLTSYPSQFDWLTGQVDRLEIKSGDVRNSVFTDMRPYTRASLAQLELDRAGDSTPLTRTDSRWYIKWLVEDLPSLNKDTTIYNGGSSRNAYLLPPRKPLIRPAFVERSKVLSPFYRYRANLLEFHGKGYNFYINPVIAVGIGGQSDTSARLYRNTRGAEIRGDIDGKVYFYTYLVDNQVGLPRYLARHVNTTQSFPGEGYIKTFKNNGIDHFTARGYISVPVTKHIAATFGNDRHHIGYGYRSLLLSDWSKDYLFLRVDTKVWRFHYRNLFTRLTDYRPRTANVNLPKYAAFHYLSLDATKWLNVGLFEGIVFHDPRANRGFDLQYLNPVIFYRAAEQGLGSSDNAFIGANVGINLVKRVRLYGQVMLDEFFLSHLRAGDGWWGNKQGIQAGIQYVDAFTIPNLDLRVETNVVRPYTYTADTLPKAYLNYGQPLAHPLGANFSEILGIIDYKPTYRTWFQVRGFYWVQGKDSGGSNLGSRLEPSNNTHPKEFGNDQNQGLRTEVMLVQGQASYMLAHNFWAEVYGGYRKETSAVSTGYTNTFGGVSLRLNFVPNRYDF